MNKVILVGRLTKDPEIRRATSDIPVAQFTVAVNRAYSHNGERQADFISCVAWRNQAENLVKYMRKGNQIGIEGQLQVRTYEDATGAKRYATEVICDNIHFLESKSSRDGGGFSDVNTYDIPDFQGGGFNDLPFGSREADSNPKSQNQIDDPFANLISKTGVTNDDLPF